ncbi:MAG: lysine--tRNA ligase [Candidatus Liptonbacteria bacterium RIFCSPLOWO2_01_FULL_52_25]|uniref:Lysine--tRNA ligase n=1 Tax=Candidatus Liptonbacteria bacterium RIFCSPLOWO2_01_FULL_52_25 TaxID=1798650 RepID=A0A1G2CES4_9BACT|nr:MAG: lysine--tRNA ligase [Candidatus Liptonbacteria bacterium RIFCSPLOWO2_01_FULL_52_25]
MLDDLIKERRKKLEALGKAGINPYPAGSKRTHTAAEAHGDFEKLSSTGGGSASGGKSGEVSLVGRVTAIRDQGDIIFLDLTDASGKFQVVSKKDTTENFALWKSVLDIGDFVSATGTLFETKKGEESVAATKFVMLSKSLRPLPSEWYGVEDVETRLRKRYLDLALNKETQDIFRKKAVFWETFREHLTKEGFLEVETPVLEAIPGGAEAEPFKTHHNALDTDFYLRISLELPLKKLLVGGFEKVFEIGRIFRNEGIDKEHLQDYTQLEFYWAYRDYNDLMKFVENMYKAVVKKVTGGLTTTYGEQKIDWGKKWKKVDYVWAFMEANKLDPAKATREELLKKAKELSTEGGSASGGKFELDKSLSKGKLIDLIFKKTVRAKLIEPCFLVNPPVEIEPLAKRSPENANVVERLQVVACGTELGKGFSELNDPLDQRRRFEEQEKARAAGDTEAQRLDEDFLEALEYGMPPAAGFGVSERFFAVLMDKPVRETVIFPLMRPRSGH